MKRGHTQNQQIYKGEALLLPDKSKFGGSKLEELSELKESVSPEEEKYTINLVHENSQQD